VTIYIKNGIKEKKAMVSIKKEKGKKITIKEALRWPRMKHWMGKIASKRRKRRMRVC
jgi:hypothetical protein